MGFSRVASLHLVPLLARLALCIVFVPIGWNKIMTVQTYTGDQAAAVRSLMEGPGEPAPSTDAEGADASAAKSPAATPAATSEPITARTVYGLAAMLQSEDVPRPLMSAWIASVVELVGGVFLLLGLLSRIWALGLAFAMGVAFALTSCPILMEVGPFGFDLAQFNRAAAQIGLGTLAIGILLSGPGAIAIDHGIFGSKRSSKDQDHESWDHDEEE